MRKPTILAVDDTPSNLVALEAVLDRDFELRFARSGPEAIASLEKDPDVAVVLLDVQMPVMDGFETAERIKRIPGCADIPIVFVTAYYNEDPHVKRGYSAGGVDYFTKPFDPDLLRLKVGIYAAFRHRLAERERQLRETQALLETGRKLSGLLETLPVGVLISDMHGRICQANEQLSRIFKSTDLINADSYGQILGWWDSAGQLLKDGGGPLARALHGNVSHNEVIQIRCIDGTSKTVLMSASPLLGIDRAIVGAVVVMQDVSESKQIERDLEDRITQLISLSVELQQSVSTT